MLFFISEVMPMMMLLFLIFLVATAIFIMMFVIVVAVAFIMMMVMIVMIMVMIMMMCLLLYLLKKRFFQIFFMADDFEKFLSGKLFNRSRNQISLRIQGTNNPNCLLYLFLFGNIRSGQNNAGRITNLVIEKLSEILVIELRLGRIHHTYRSVQMHGEICRYRLHSRKNIGKLSYTGRLDKDSVRLIGLNHFL